MKEHYNIDVFPSKRFLWLSTSMVLLGACAEGSLSRTVGPGSHRKGEDLEVYDESNLQVVAKRGVELYAMEKAIRIAYRDGLPQAGKINAASLLPLAGVDPGLRSGEVVFYRWSTELPDEQLQEPQQARKWLVVPILLDPDRLLALETMDETVDPKSASYFRLFAVLNAARIALERYPKGTWHFHTFRELRSNSRGKGQTRVYMLGKTTDSPDLELLIPDDLERESINAETSDLLVTFLGSKEGGSALHVETDIPSPLTVARVLSRPASSQMWANVVTKDGVDWRIHRKSGTLQRSSATSSAPQNGHH